MKRIAICINRRLDYQSSCAARGSVALADAFETVIAEQHLPLRVMRLPCMGLCEMGPNVKAVGGDLWHEVSEEDIPAILQAVME